MRKSLVWLVLLVAAAWGCGSSKHARRATHGPAHVSHGTRPAPAPAHHAARPAPAREAPVHRSSPASSGAASSSDDSGSLLGDILGALLSSDGDDDPVSDESPSEERPSASGGQDSGPEEAEAPAGPRPEDPSLPCPAPGAGPPGPTAPDPSPGPEALPDVKVRLLLRAGMADGGATGGGSALVEIDRWAIEAGLDTFEVRESVPFQYSSLDASYAFLSGPRHRLRLDLGLAFTSLGQQGDEAVEDLTIGFQGGISGQLGLVGPLHLEAQARYSPAPVRVTDLEAGLMLELGFLSVTAGWRDLRTGSSPVAPPLLFRGPYFGMAAHF